MLLCWIISTSVSAIKERNKQGENLSGPSVRRAAQPAADDSDMEMLRRSSVFAAEVFDRSPTDKELVSQAKSLCRDYIHSRLNRAGVGWSKAEHGLASSSGTMGDVSSVLLWLGEGVQL